MKMNWMGEYRDIVEALIHYCNIYADVYKHEHMVFQDVTYSFSQVQVLEYLLENEERQENMSAIAYRLGISRSNFTKIVNKLEAKGLVKKQYMQGSRKELVVTVNDLEGSLRGLFTGNSEVTLLSHVQAAGEDPQGILPPPQRRTVRCHARRERRRLIERLPPPLRTNIFLHTVGRALAPAAPRNHLPPHRRAGACSRRSARTSSSAP